MYTLMILTTRKKYYFYQSAEYYYISEILLIQLCTTPRGILYKVLFEISSIIRLLEKIAAYCAVDVQQQCAHTIIHAADGTLWIPADSILDTNICAAGVIKDLISDIYTSEGRRLEIIEKDTMFTNEIITHATDNTFNFINSVT